MFYTPVTLHPLKQKINLHDPVITAGSCFADCMGDKFRESKFNVLANPFGTVYNPVSLHRQYLLAMNNGGLDEDNVTQTQGLYFHYDFHSRFSGDSKKRLISMLKENISEVHSMLKNARWFIITWGTAWIYQLESNNDIVANCHKQPQKQFHKRLLTHDEIISDFKLFHKALKELNPNIRIILTLSPVRHLADTLPMNMVSKSLLRVAAHMISSEYSDIHYFPAYEIMLDELRDYRFYKEDMIHPTAQAEDYIWEKFKGAGIDEDTRNFMRQWQEIRKSMAHKAFNPNSEAHQKFLKNTLEKLEKLSDKVDTGEEIKEIRSRIV